MSYLEIFKNSFTGYFNYITYEITHPSWDNYFYALLFFSLVVWLLELIFPWRKNQAIFRKDFWLDFFYMFFNFFIFNLIAFIALGNVSEQLFKDILNVFNIQTIQIFEINSFPRFARLFIFFILTDFIQWNTHRLLHRVPFLWEFHKVHHSVKEMGFAAHLRYHWMETIVYRTLLYIPVAIIGGFNVQDVIFVHYIALLIGHLNHANIHWNYGFLKYIFNNPKMHIWHHAKEVPNIYGVNFGISLSVWDYIFKTNYIPFDGKDITIGFEGEENFPNNFISQEIYPFFKKK